MEDIQDGKKVSIQDGVKEDPEMVEKLDPKGKSGAMILYVGSLISNPQIITELLLSTDAVKKTATMTTVLDLQVA